VFERAIGGGLLSAAAADLIQREVTSRMADIGALEGSEEAGVEDISDVDTMVERVHRVRGGQLMKHCCDGHSLKCCVAADTPSSKRPARTRHSTRSAACPRPSMSPCSTTACRIRRTFACSRRCAGASPRAPVMLMTAYGTPEMVQGALDWGAYCVLSKPFDMHTIASMVADAYHAAHPH